MHLRFRCLGVVLASMLAVVLCAAAQDRAAGLQTAFARAQHLQHGINASQWFAQSANDYSAARTNRYIDSRDIALMARLGFDNVRLSIDAVPLEQYPRGADGLNADFVGRLDNAVDTMLADGLAVEIDLHPEDSYKQQLRTSNDAVDRLTMLWRKLAAHYANARSRAGLLRDHERAGGQRSLSLGRHPGAGGGGHPRGGAPQHHHRHRARIIPTSPTCSPSIRWPTAT